MPTIYLQCVVLLLWCCLAGWLLMRWFLIFLLVMLSLIFVMPFLETMHILVSVATRFGYRTLETCHKQDKLHNCHKCFPFLHIGQSMCNRCGQIGRTVHIGEGPAGDPVVHRNHLPFLILFSAVAQLLPLVLAQVFLSRLLAPFWLATLTNINK